MGITAATTHSSLMTFRKLESQEQKVHPGRMNLISRKVLRLIVIEEKKDRRVEDKDCGLPTE